MIAHVAEAGEGRGRVVLRFSVGTASPQAIEAAVRVARAFQSEVEGLFIEDAQLLDLAGYGFAREISFSGRRQRQVSARGLRSAFRASFIEARRRMEAAAQAADVPLQVRFVRDEPLNAIAAACAQKGPWNVIVLAEAVGSGSPPSIREVFDQVKDATGLVLAGPNAVRSAGPVIVVVEDLERLSGMVRLAERLAASAESEVLVVLLANDPMELAQLDGEVRLMLADRPDIRLALSAVVHGSSAAAAEIIRRLRGGVVIARFDGIAVPDNGGWRAFVGSLECPLFLVR